MPIEVSCACGRRLRAKDEMAGRQGKCPNCGAMLTIPALATPADEYELAERPASPPTVRPPPPPPLADSMPSPPPPRLRAPRSPVGALVSGLPQDWNRYLYVLLVLALIPLAVSTLRPAPSDDLDRRIDKTVESHQELQKEIGDLPKDHTPDDILRLLPGDRVDGALLPRQTWMHWLLALASAGAYLGLILLIFPRAVEKPWQLAAVGLFTATIGIMLLLALQWVAALTQGIWLRGSGWITLIFYIIKFIGYSYHAALDPDSNLVLSCLGFMCGVGLCEEFFKALPVILHFTNSRFTWSWRAACAFGLASGMGFGVAEGIRYASNYYNGYMTGGIYGVRFISCVALHGMWTGGAAIGLYRRHKYLQASNSFDFKEALIPLIVPIILHGLYDTFLKKEMDVWSLVVAAVTFGWFVWQVETTRRKYSPVEERDPLVSARRFA